MAAILSITVPVGNILLSASTKTVLAVAKVVSSSHQGSIDEDQLPTEDNIEEDKNSKIIIFCKTGGNWVCPKLSHYLYFS